MEIDKIQFGQMAEQRGVDAAFEDLDVNNDGRITSADLELAKNSDIKNSIANILDGVDEDNDIVLLDETEELSSMVKAGGKKSSAAEEEWLDTTREQSAKDGIPVTDKENFEKDVLNSTGVTYVVMGYLGGCSHCNELEAVLAQFKDELKDVCNIYNMSWGENIDFCRDLAYNQAGVKPPAGFPCVLKFYNGKLVSRTYSGYGSSTNVDAQASWAGEAFYTGYQYKDENGRTKSCKEYNPQTHSLEWKHTPMLIDLIKKDVAETKENPNVLRDANGQLRTTADRFDEDVKKSKGTTYVVMGCIGCNAMLMGNIRQNQSKLAGVANVFQMDWEDSANTELCRKIAYEMGKLEYPAHFPVVAKFVDGEFVEIIPRTNDHSTWRDDAIQALIDNAVGTPQLNGQTDTSAEKANEEETTQMEKTGADNQDKVKVELKSKLKSLRNDIYEKEFWRIQLQNKADEIKEEYKKQKENSQNSSNSNLENLKSQEKIYTTQLDSVNAEISRLNLLYLEIEEQLK
ncbi:MAG: thioredoxin family protein [bacterium]|nr:thioredoxin family protein [bacterium]